ncbi:T9SS type A sorting domain-containing protein [Segatella copri]
MTIYDVSGRLIRCERVLSNVDSISIYDQPSGIYVIKVAQEIFKIRF